MTASTLSAARAAADDAAQRLVTAFALLPAADPSRPAARERAISAWLPMAERLARRYVGRGESFDDLRQTAMLGLINAVDRFDPTHGADFVGFALPTVLGEIRRHFRDRGWAIRVPRRIQETARAIAAADSDLTHLLSRRPTVAEVATRLGISQEEVIEGMEGGRAYRALSLALPAGPDGSAELGDMLGQEDPAFARAEFRAALGPAMTCLTAREQKIIMLRFFGNQSQTRIAEQIGVSQMQISRLLAVALAKLRDQMN